MGDYFLQLLLDAENLLWGYAGVPALLLLGILLSYQSGMIQVVKLPIAIRNFLNFMGDKESGKRGIHPLKAFFACVGGCIGVGNIVAICTAIQLGGPGALFWIWITALLGMPVKYAEVFLAIRNRVPNGSGGYNGGPMYYLQRIVKGKWLPAAFCLLLCIYGVEIYQFRVIIQSVAINAGIAPWIPIATLLLLVFFAGAGGVRRVGVISSAIIPLFIVIYMGMSLWILVHNIGLLPGVLAQIFGSAFSAQAAFGGFLGSTLMTTISQGARRGAYTGDIGIGYAGMIHSETCSTSPEKQASLTFVEIFLDTFMICTSSVLVILLTDLWHQPMETSLLIQSALALYFPYMDFFMPFFLFLLGYSTINAYFVVGLKSADFISPTYGRAAYYIYSIITFVLFSLVESQFAQALMGLSGALLLLLNGYAIFMLRNEVSYNIGEPEVVFYH